MKIFLLSSSILIWAASASWANDPTKNFILTIDGTDYELNVDEIIKGKVKSGFEFEVKLARKEFSSFTQGKVSFEYRSDLSVASTDVDKGVRQHLVASALGTIVIVQQYDRISPEGLEEFMLSQLTDSAANSSANLEKSEATRTLAGGTTLKGIKAKFKSGTEDADFEVLTTPRKEGGGVMAITRLNNDATVEDRKIIDRFWASLKIVD